MMYVNKETLSIDSHQHVQRKCQVYKSTDFTVEELAEIGYAVLVEPASGDVRTGNAVLVNGQYEREYKPYTAEQQINQAKAARDAVKVSPLTVTLGGVDYVFDMDKTAQDNINTAIAEWAIIDATTGSTGSIAWTLADNKELSVTLADLHTVRQKAAIRGIQLHFEYNAIKAALTV